jgi:acyl-CoA thioester hydrolase
MDRMSRKPPGRRADFRYFQSLTTRWKDNDLFGHVNNVEYLSFFDTALTLFEMKHAGIDLINGAVRCVMAETNCRYYTSVSFPDVLTVGLRVAHLGNSSFSYDLGLFRDDENVAAAEGRFVRVVVAMPGQRPIRIPDELRSALGAFAVAA